MLKNVKMIILKNKMLKKLENKQKKRKKEKRLKTPAHITTTPWQQT